MDSRLLANLDDKAQKEFLQEFINSRVREQVEQILLQWKDELEKNPVGDYEVPSWAYLRADKDGQLRTLRKVLDLIKL